MRPPSWTTLKLFQKRNLKGMLQRSRPPVHELPSSRTTRKRHLLVVKLSPCVTLSMATKGGLAAALRWSKSLNSSTVYSRYSFHLSLLLCLPLVTHQAEYRAALVLSLQFLQAAEALLNSQTCNSRKQSVTVRLVIDVTTRPGQHTNLICVNTWIGGLLETNRFLLTATRLER